MNIFILDKTAQGCAQAHCDQHVVKMTLETAQILCTALRLKGFENVPYQSTHVNHPCVQWVLENKSNFNWLALLGFHLGGEYRFRFGKTHASEYVIGKCISIGCGWQSNILERTPFVQCMPDQFKRPDAIQAYRRYYRTKKFAEWKRGRVPPIWWLPHKEGEITTAVENDGIYSKVK